MMASIGMLFRDGFTGSARRDWALYMALPWLAFENKMGAHGPVGFWDPLSFTSDGIGENSRRRRQTELKLGRISMLAAMGYIT